MMGQAIFTNQFERNAAEMHQRLRVDDSFDMLRRDVDVGGRRAAMFFIDAFTKDEIIEKILEFLLGLTSEDFKGRETSEAFAARFLPYTEIDREYNIDTAVTRVLSGTMALLVEGYDQAFMVDARTYPVRSISEPQDDRVLRGSHDGFVETLVFNAGMLRRRIRDPRLRLEALAIGRKSQTDVALCYLDGIADKKQVDKLRQKLKAITIPSLTMGQESLLECLFRRQFYNPFPKVRYTERPDCASACVMEGKILIMIDNVPSAMILPTAVFDFLQDTNDYYFPPLVGTYLRWVRGVVFLLTLFLTPVWYLLVENPQMIPPWLDFLRIDEPNGVALIVQLLIVELMIDVIKLASLNTPNVLNNAFGVVGALILGEFAVSAGWFVPEVLLYMAFATVSTFTQSSYELGYTFKLFRMLLLVLTALLNVWGFAAGLVLIAVTLATTDTVFGKRYLYPLIPFNGQALRRLFTRRALTRHNS